MDNSKQWDFYPRREEKREKERERPRERPHEREREREHSPSAMSYTRYTTALQGNSTETLQLERFCESIAERMDH